MTKSKNILAPRKYFSDDERDLIRELYPHLPTSQLAAQTGRTSDSIYRVANLMGVHKSPEFLDSDLSGRLKKGQTRPGSEPTQFHKGNIPPNKGLRRPGFGPGRMKETQFRKGERSGIAARNWVPVGTIHADPEGYLRIKIREAIYGKEPTGYGNVNVWPLYHRHVWTQHHGPIPSGYLVVFKDGDRNNCDIGNLELMSMADNARRNSMWARYPRELAEAIQLNGALKNKIRRMTDGKKQNQ